MPTVPGCDTGRMCFPVPCSECGKTTWSGCGLHVDEVRAAVPVDEWCGHDGA